MAGRRGNVRYYPSRNAYFTTYRGKTQKLADGPEDGPSGPNFLAAVKAFTRILEDAAAGTAKDNNTIATIIQRYLQWLQPRRTAGTYKIRKRYLQPFLTFVDQGSKPFGELRICELMPHHIERFCDYMRTPRYHSQQKQLMRWTAGSISIFHNSIHAALNWAAGPKQRLIETNPIKGIEKPSGRSRGAAHLVPPEMHRKAVAAAGSDLKQLLIVCENTGCRPGELFMAEARHFDDQLGALIFRSQAHLQEGEKGHKTSGKDKDRVIILTGDALVLVKELVFKYPTGNLFRTSKQMGCAGGLPWTKQAIFKRIKTLRRKTGLPRTFTLYSYRHQYATAWLKSGRSIDDLAVLLGNTPAIIRRNYSHLCDDHDRLRKIAETFQQKMTVQEPLAFASSIKEAI